MRCKKCDYRLWNLTERRCPECGTPFRPSEFEFVPNSVQFCCPHCGQAYYGTGAKGHLVPAAFSCVTCGAAIQMDETILLPASGVQEEQTKVAALPWLERKNRGLLRAWLATVGAALVSPGRLMQALPERSSIWPARGFAALTLLVVAAVAVGPFSVLPFLMSSPMTGFAVQRIFLTVAVTIAITFGVLAFCTLVWGLAAHGLLRITGRTAGNSRRTMQAVYYSTGANVLTAIPCLGFYVGWVWWVVSAVLMVREAQRVGGGRAALAVVLPPLAVLGSIVGCYVWLIVSVMPSLNTAGLPQPGISRAETATVLQAVLRYARAHGGQGPRHASQLVACGALRAANFVGSASGTTAAAVPIGSTTLDRLDTMTGQGAQAAVAVAVAALPEGTVAHRVGDFVFVYHGVDLSAADGRLWVVIAAPDPLAGVKNVTRGVCVGCADGSVTAISAGALPAALAVQNALRAGRDLPPLPDLTTVTHERPAVASP
jgi:hypothetical protein